MREYQNIEKLIREKKLTADKIALTVNNTDKNNNFVQQRLINGIEGVNCNEYLYLKETVTVKEKIAYSQFEGTIYNARELKVLSQERSDSDIFWKTIHKSFIDGVVL